jgi:hypothetical protein
MANYPVSKEHYIPAANGDYPKKVDMGSWGNHQVAVKVLGSLTTGTLSISAKAPGSNTFELVPDGVVDLTAPTTVLFTFSAYEYNFNLTSVTGATAGSQVVITDIPLEL